MGVGIGHGTHQVQGFVEGVVRALRLIVLGEVRGEVRGAERVEIGPGGRLMGSVDPEKNLVRRIGIVGVPIDSVNAGLIPSLRVPSGVLVLARASYAGGVESGLASGDVIHAVNGAPIGTLDDLRAALRRFQAGDPVVLQIERQGRFTFLAFEIY